MNNRAIISWFMNKINNELGLKVMKIKRKNYIN
jgi:hypothetical protein